MKVQRVVITGLGVVSSLGLGWRTFWNALLAGCSGIREIRYIDTTGFPTHYGGEVESFNASDFMSAKAEKRLGRATQFTLAASRMALDDAGVHQLSDSRIGICLGTTMADIQALEEINSTWTDTREHRVRSSLVAKYPSCTMSAGVAWQLGFTGPNVMIPTACAAGNYALAYAYDLLCLRKADLMVAGGADAFSRIAFMGFNRLFAVAPERCQPFDRNRKGMIVGEGAGMLVLERLEAAEARRAPIYGEIVAYGLSCDANHMTIPHIAGVKAAMQNALRAAQISPEEVNYINAHGTGTPANDRTEAQAIREVFGKHASTLPVSSIKSMIGHAMGAASALESIATILAVKSDHIPPTINFETPDPECDIDCVPNTSRRQRVSIALKNAFAFGGNNACVVYRKYS